MHKLSARAIDVRAEWTLSAALQIMSECALKGLSVRHAQAVVAHLRAVAANRSVPAELRSVCDKLCGRWQAMEVQ